MHCTPLYAVKAQTSQAPLSRFRGSRITTAHAHQCCRFQSYAKTVPSEIDNEIDKAWTNIPGIHDNGPRDHGLWRLTLTAYYAETLTVIVVVVFLALWLKKVLCASHNKIKLSHFGCYGVVKNTTRLINDYTYLL